MKTITFTFENEINDYGKRTETKVKKVADLTLDDNTEFSSIINFMDDIKKIWKLCTKPYGNAYEYRQLEVTISVMGKNADGTFYSINFDRWTTRNNDDFCTDKDEPLVYLIADEKYTESNRDMAIGKNIYADIAFTIG